MDLITHAFDGTAGYAPQGVGARSVLPPPEGGVRTPSFGDMLSALNPLQHLPVVGAIYRHLTGDAPHPAAQVVGGAIFGGPVGLLAGVISAAFEQTTGKTPLQVAIGAIAPASPEEPLAALAQAMPEAEPAGLSDAGGPAQQVEAPPPMPSVPPAGAIVVARAAAPAPRPQQPPAPQPPAGQQTATLQSSQATEIQARPSPFDPQGDAPPPPPPAARVVNGRDLAFYQTHAGGRLPPSGNAGNGRALLGGPQVQRVQPHAQLASLPPARDAEPAAQLRRVASLAADQPAAAAAAVQTADTAQRGDDFATRMLQGLERYRAMSRAGDGRAATPAVVLTR